MASKILEYVEQPDARTCQSAAIAKVIGTTDVQAVRAELDAIAAKRGSIAGDPGVMATYLDSEIDDYRFTYSGSLRDVRQALTNGAVVITHGWFTDSGHVVTIVGTEPDPRTLSYSLIVDDPWYEFNFPTWSYTRRHGNNRTYSSYGMYAAIVASVSPWQAQQIYTRGELDSAKEGAWLHICKN